MLRTNERNKDNSGHLIFKSNWDSQFHLNPNLAISAEDTINDLVFARLGALNY